MPMLTVLLALTGTALGDNAVVGPTDSIVDVINALPGGGPHFIDISSGGRYIETQRLDVGSRNLTITGTGYTTTTWMYDGALSEMITVGVGGSLTIEDLTLDGSDPIQVFGDADVDLCNFSDNRTGIVATNAVSVDLVGAQLRCFFSYSSGGGIRASGTNVSITDSYFWENIALYDGGHVYIQDGSTFDSTNSDYLYGLATLGSGGGVYTTETAATFTDNYFRNNESSVRGGGIFTSSNTDNIILHGNKMQQNVSLLVTRFSLLDDDLVLVDTADRFNEFSTFAIFTGDGGGAYVFGQTTDIWNNMMCGNLANNGAGLAQVDPQNTTIENNVFNENYSLHYGGGLYIFEGLQTNYPTIVNNSFMGNSAGQNPPGFLPVIYVYGAGGAMMLDGTLADFRNNIVAYTRFGAGMTGLDGANYTIGDPIVMDHNIWYWNCEQTGCLEDPIQWFNLAGDFATHTLSPLNYEFDPFPAYYGGIDLDCYPDAFYTTFDSAAIDNGDPALNDVGGSQSDIGAYGGPRADVVDADGDGIENIYDCNDQDVGTNPNVNEVCDFLDNNCNGEVDENFPNEWWFDDDNDGYGDATHFMPDLITCTNQPTMVDNNDDCDDANVDINPTALEICDGVDNDCNGIADDEETLPRQVFYLDDDGDGYGSSVTLTDCVPPNNMPPPGYADQGNDCDDGDDQVNPGMSETCDGIDNDCNGTIDDEAPDGSNWYEDLDGDGYGTDSTMENSCDSPGENYVADLGGDCNDDPDPEINDDAENAFAMNPGQLEICGDEIDNNCDGDIDGEVEPDTPNSLEYSLDADGDGLGDPTTTGWFCEQPAGYTEHTGNDCDDEDELIGKCNAGCSCQTTSPSAPFSLVILVAGLLTIRRRLAGE